MRIAICDDCESDALEIVEIVKTNPRIEPDMLSVFHSGTELLGTIRNGGNYDIVLLDIEMPEISGIELGKKIKCLSPDTKIIFITNYPEFAIEAFDCSAFHYLLKPLSADKTNSVLNELIEKHILDKAEYSVKTKDGFINIPIKDITYIEYVDRHLIFHVGKEKYEIPGKISEANAYFSNYDFCQIHQSIVVNMKKIVSVDKQSVRLADGNIIPISQRKKSAVLSNYVTFLKEALK